MKSIKRSTSKVVARPAAAPKRATQPKKSKPASTKANRAPAKRAGS